MELGVKCSVCLGGNAPLENMWDTDHNNMKWSSKLKLCVPEVEWSEDYLICKICIKQLESVYEFRDLCMKSFAIRKYLNKSTTCINFLGNPNTNLLYHCKHCIEVFKSSEELAQHNRNVHLLVECSYNCIYCDQDFKSSLELLQHEVTHFNMVDYKNVGVSHNREFDCTVDLNSIKPLDCQNMHINEHDSLYNCYNCKNTFTTKLLLITHLDSCKFLNINQTAVNDNRPISKSEKYECNKCFDLFATIGEMKMHLSKCGEMRPNCDSEQKINSESFHEDTEDNGNEEIAQVKDLPVDSAPIETRLISVRSKKRGRQKLDKTTNICPICGMTFNSRYLSKRHIHNVHATEKKYQCDMCEQKFVSTVYLNAHKRYHSGERPHICTFCGKGFITGSDLYHHEKIHANKRAYKCEKCSKAYNTSSDLHKHKLCVHIDRSQWKYVCSFCDRRFPLKSNLDAHIKTHTGERNFSCHLCEQKCINRSVLMQHIKSHSNVRLFKCSLCQIEYKYQKSLDIHMTKAHGIGDTKIPERIKKFFCHICPKSYFVNSKFQKHIRTHTGERPFSCQMCEKRFIDKSYVKQHLKTAHHVIFCQTD